MANLSAFFSRIVTRPRWFANYSDDTALEFLANGLRNPKKKVFFFVAENKSALIRVICGLKHFHRVQHGLDARDFVRTEQIGFAQRGQHGEKRLGAADFIAKKFKGVW